MYTDETALRQKELYSSNELKQHKHKHYTTSPTMKTKTKCSQLSIYVCMTYLKHIIYAYLDILQVHTKWNL